MTTRNLELGLNSATGGSIHLTIASNVARTSSQECREAMVRPMLTNAGTVRCLFQSSTVVCTSVTGMEINNMAVVYPCPNTNQLSFWGNTDGDQVDIQWRT